MRLPGPNDTIDATFARAVHAGARVTAPVACMYWGDRFGRVIDPFGITWGIATHVEGVPLAEMQRRAQAAASA
jgi:PhnB protein